MERDQFISNDDPNYDYFNVNLLSPDMDPMSYYFKQGEAVNHTKATERMTNPTPAPITSLPETMDFGDLMEIKITISIKWIIIIFLFIITILCAVMSHGLPRRASFPVFN